MSPTERVDRLVVLLDSLRDRVAPLRGREAELVCAQGLAQVVARVLHDGVELCPDDRALLDLYARIQQSIRAGEAS